MYDKNWPFKFHPKLMTLPAHFSITQWLRTIPLPLWQYKHVRNTNKLHILLRIMKMLQGLYSCPLAYKENIIGNA